MFVWGEMGHAFIQLLESKVWLALICKHMECYPFMHHVELKLVRNLKIVRRQLWS